MRDGQDDVNLIFKKNDTGEIMGCLNAGGRDWHIVYFVSTLNVFGLNKVNTKITLAILVLIAPMTH